MNNKSQWYMKSTMKGQALLEGILTLFATVLVVWILTIIFQGGIFTNHNVTQAFHTSPPSQKVLAQGSGFFTGLNTVIAFMYIFIALGALILAYKTESNPGFAALGIALLPIEILFSFGFHDAFFAMIQTSAFGALAIQYPFILLTFQYLPIATFVLSLMIIIMTFSK